jgi:hypothetical protein
MEPMSTNGNPSSARQALDAMRQVIDNLEADLARKKEEIEQLRTERDEYRSLVYEHLKKQFDPKDWDDFNEKDYTLTIDDLVAIIDKR